MVLELTTLALVKSQLGKSVSSDDDYLSAAILSVSKRFEREMNRHVVTQARTEVYEVPPNRQLFGLRGFPVTSIASMYWDKDNRNFSGNDALVANEDYTLDSTNGLVRLYFRLRGWKQSVGGRTVHPAYFQVTYTGGMALDEGSPSTTSANIIADYPDLAQAAADQISYLFRRRDNMGSNKTLQGSSSSFEEAYTLLPDVRKTLAAYRVDTSWAQ